MAKSSPEKLAKALRANLKRRKGPGAQHGRGEGHAPKRALECSPAKTSVQPSKNP